MKFSNLLIPILKENPGDALLKSHKLLVRAGYISQVGAGLYNLLPLGKKMLDKIKAIVKEEMDNAGAQEILMCFVTPAIFWELSGRLNQYGKELLRLKDRKNNDFVLGPTHEEIVCDIAKNFIKSYKQLPINLYQINTKFRDEARPRFGLLRAREFVMKDAYSFHESFEDLDREFDNMQASYERIFTRLGLDFKIVEADSGAIGGSGSKEFMVLAESGEDTLVVCSFCDYSANIEAARCQARTRARDTSLYPHGAPKANFAKFLTKGVKSVDEVAKFFNVNPFYIVKSIAYKALFELNGEMQSEVAVFYLRGDDELESAKALKALSSLHKERIYLDLLELEDSKPEKLNTTFVGGSQKQMEVVSIFDETLKGAENMISSADEMDYHVVGLNMDALEFAQFFDIAHVQEGDACVHCGQKLIYKKGIEVGHIFKLGTKYSNALGAHFLDKNGKSAPFVMGCYGIGISRLLSAMLEQSADEFGCVWNEKINVFDVQIIISNIKNVAQNEFANKLYKEFKARGADVLLDDRNERFGHKIKDFELIGSRFGLIIGNVLEEGNVELIERKGLVKSVVPKDAIVNLLLDKLGLK